MKELIDLAQEIQKREGVVLEFIDSVDFVDGQIEEIYYMTDPENKRTEKTIVLVLVYQSNESLSFVASIGLSQIPSYKFHTHEQFIDIIINQSEHAVDASTVKLGSIDECLRLADVYPEWVKKFSSHRKKV